VATVKVEAPWLESLRGLRFVDTPGLESALAHNTEASLRWLPNVGLALVAVGIDTPLSQRDIELLKSLRQYTPNISILLTKADLLDEAERAEALLFVREQLSRAGLDTSQILFYSVRPGYEQFKARVEENLLRKTLVDFERQRRAIIERKLETALGECADYLTLALASTETADEERESLRRQVVGEKEVVDEVKGEIRLVVRHETGGARARTLQRLNAHQTELEERLREALQAEFPNWTRSLEFALQSYEAWLRRSLTEELLTISRTHRAEFLAPLEKVRRQVFRHLQSFRDQLSERTVRAFGVPLRTAEIDLEIEEPLAPDIRIGKVFDRSWESLSAITPMWLAQGIVERRFGSRLAWMVEKNLSRLATQWADSVNAAGAAIEREAERRLDELLATVTRLIASGADEAPQIRVDLTRLNSARDEMRGTKSQEVAG